MRRLATSMRTTRTFASAPATPRIAICGAGVSGLTLAGILSNSSRDVQITVFERARADRDQGYGLDLDEHGQEALVRAGVYDRYWDISYPYSDTSVCYQFRGAVRGQAPRGAHEGLVRVGAQARRRRHVSGRRAALRERREAARRTEEISITGLACV